MTDRGYHSSEGFAMKHWLFVSTLIIVATVLIVRSRVSKRSTLTPATALSTLPTTLPAGGGSLFPQQRTLPIPMH